MVPFKEQVPEFEIYERSLVWHVAAGVIAGVMLAWGIFSTNYLFTAFVILAAIALIVRDARTPQSISFTIEKTIISLGKKEWNTDEFKGFTLLQHDEHSTSLILIPAKKLAEAYPIRVMTREPEKAAHALDAAGLKEIEYDEPLLDSLIRLLKL